MEWERFNDKEMQESKQVDKHYCTQLNVFCLNRATAHRPSQKTNNVQRGMTGTADRGAANDVINCETSSAKVISKAKTCRSYRSCRVRSRTKNILSSVWPTENVSQSATLQNVNWNKGWLHEHLSQVKSVQIAIVSNHFYSAACNANAV